MLLKILVILVLGVVLFLLFAPQLGRKPFGEHLEGIKKSPQYKLDKFENSTVIDMSMSFSQMVGFIREIFSGRENRRPSGKLPSEELETVLDEQEPYLTWFGHSTFFYEVAGKNILFDPIFSDHASPLHSMIKRYEYDLPAHVGDLPPIDYVVLSHDHYDHLDYRSIKDLAEKVAHFVVPLGVGSHLVQWGIAESRITELDWDDAVVMEGITFRAVESQHFSGRTVNDRQKTLWAAWIIEVGDSKVFFGGDSGYFEGFKKIGEDYGPFDLTLLDAGQYNKLWEGVHMFPEESVRAHQELRGEVYMPIHWSAFTLSTHDWTDPVEKALLHAQEEGVTMITPVIGERFHIKNDLPQRMWWKGL